MRLMKLVLMKNVYGKFFDVAGKGEILTFGVLYIVTGADNYFKNATYYSEIYALTFRETLKQIQDWASTKMNKASDAMATLITDPLRGYNSCL